jgi:hypothetical protein
MIPVDFLSAGCLRPTTLTPGRCLLAVYGDSCPGPTQPALRSAGAHTRGCMGSFAFAIISALAYGA